VAGRLIALIGGPSRRGTLFALRSRGRLGETTALMARPYAPVAHPVDLPERSTPAVEASPSDTGLRSLDAVNLLLAAALSGFGPYVAVFLAEQDWTQPNIGFVLTAAGFAGLLALRRLRQMCAARDLHPVIEVDGGENVPTTGRVVAAGATAIVAGSAIFGARDYAAAIAAIRESAASAVAQI
jgi:hypothetical protein